MQNMMSGNGLQRAGGRVRGFGAGDLGDQPCGQEGLKNLLRQTAGDVELKRNFLKRDGGLSALKTLSDARHQPQGNEFASALVDIFN